MRHEQSDLEPLPQSGLDQRTGEPRKVGGDDAAEPVEMVPCRYCRKPTELTEYGRQVALWATKKLLARGERGLMKSEVLVCERVEFVNGKERKPCRERWEREIAERDAAHQARVDDLLARAAEGERVSIPLDIAKHHPADADRIRKASRVARAERNTPTTRSDDA